MLMDDREKRDLKTRKWSCWWRHSRRPNTLTTLAVEIRHVEALW